MARRQTSKQWLHAHINDPYVKQSKLDGYRSRAVYKLKEVDDKVGLIKPGMCILELGAAPGGWTQYVVEKLQGRGSVIAVDCLKMDPLPGVNFIQGDFTDESVQAAVQQSILGKKFDLILSDVAPNLSGVKMMDSLRATALAEGTIETAETLLKADGNLFMKLFHGVGFDDLIREARKKFNDVSIRKPLASRAQSRETYLLALGYRL